MIRSALPLALVTVLTFGAGAQKQTNASAGQTAITTTRINERVHVISGAGANITVLSGPDGIALFDAGDGTRSERVLREIRKLSSAPIRYVILLNSYQHSAGGVRSLAGTAAIVSHPKVRHRLRQSSVTGNTGSSEIPFNAAPSLVSIDEMRLYMNGEEVQLKPLSEGQSDGFMVVHLLTSDLVLTGDLFVQNRFPFLDIENGARVDRFIARVDWLVSGLPPETKVVPGRGGVATIADMGVFSAAVAEAAALVGNAKEKGESLESMKERRILKKWERWSSDKVSLEAFTTMLFDGMPYMKPRPGRS